MGDVLNRFEGLRVKGEFHNDDMICSIQITLRLHSL